MSRLDYSFKQSRACFSPEWSFHESRQIILGNVNVSSCLKAAVSNLKNPLSSFDHKILILCHQKER